VFTSQKGGKLDRSAFFRVFQAVATEAGLPPEKRHPHCLKHSLGFAMVEANRSLTTIQNALGHRSVASTGIYAQPSREQADHAVQAPCSNCSSCLSRINPRQAPRFRSEFARFEPFHGRIRLIGLMRSLPICGCKSFVLPPTDFEKSSQMMRFGLGTRL
jgi:Phage integrase family